MEETLGKRIVFHRKRLELTQDQLAEKLGVSAQAVSKWENDQSCPDISALPQLADIFGITVDALLGRTGAEKEKEDTMPVYEAEVVDEERNHKHRFEMPFQVGKKHYIGPAFWVIAVGLFYLANVLFDWRLSFWDVLWPTSLLIFGLFNLFPKFSFLSLSCILAGGYVITCHFLPNPVINDSRIIWAALIILLGISLLADGIRKRKRAKNYAEHFQGGSKFSRSLNMEEKAFDYDASFGSDRANIELPVLQAGDIDVSFGDFVVDLQGVGAVDPDCKLDVDASFGELTIYVPRRFEIKLSQDINLAGIRVKGQPFSTPEGVIYTDADVSFGSLVIEYT